MSKNQTARKVLIPIVIASLVGTLGLMAVALGSGVKIGGDLKHMFDSIKSVEKTRPATDTMLAKTLKSLEIQGANQVTITASKDDVIHVAATLHGFGTTDQEAVDALAGIQWKLRQEGDRAVIKVESPDSGVRFNGRINGKRFGQADGVDLVIQVPARFAVIVEGEDDDVRVRGVGAARITTDSGRIEAEDLHGALSAEADSGSVTANRVTGAATLTTDSGRIVARQIGGNLLANADSGAIEVESVGGRTELKSDNGRITVEGVKGVLVAESDSGSITATGVGGGAILHTDNGRITGIRLGGSMVTAQTSTGGISLEQPGILATSYDLSSEHGRIDVSLPADVSLHVDLSSYHGGVDSHLPLADQVKHDDHGRSSLQGRLKTGTQELRAKSETGSITLHQTGK